MGRKCLLALVVLAAAAAIYLLKNCKCCNPPAPPRLDLDEWWGPAALRGKVDTAVRPFKVEFSQEMVTDLKRRLSSWHAPPPPLETAGFRYGFNSRYLQQVVAYWRDSYDAKERQAFLNTLPHYKTQIQGLDIHWIHAKPKLPSGSSVVVVPLLLLHGWPGSVREFYEVIPLLTTPNAKYNLVFEVIAPSLPGYGFSQGASRPGCGAVEVAVIMKNLMQRLGFKEYYIQGGDWGAIIGSYMSTLFPDEVLGYHTNMAMILTKKANIKSFIGSFYPPLVVEDEYADRMYPLKNKYSHLLEETGYFHLQATKPDTVGTALSDSPVGLAAYILEKFSTWANPTFRSEEDGKLTKNFKLDDLLDNIMIYWSTNSITTSMRLYAETINKRTFGYEMDEIATPVPTWAMKTRYELAFQPDGILKEKYPNLLGSTVLDKGGHFAAFELPKEFAADVFKAVSKFRKFAEEKQTKTEL